MDEGGVAHRDFRTSGHLLASKPSHIRQYSPYTAEDMISPAAARTTTSLVARRGFHTTRARMSSPYHYPEGAYSNIPFNPRSKWFGAGYWGFMATGFFAPFGIAVYQTYKSD
ncbi:Cytochrome c oxidase polypeptide VIIc [Cladobotryum mycophilum]|uniref:Cytochrome c oxidase polypeptide VIIc n=1 Tax=Cladobotryum mycophilum TaxID=491253 RepID=A0ABR0SZT0_9HYPO